MWKSSLYYFYFFCNLYFNLWLTILHLTNVSYSYEMEYWDFETCWHIIDVKVTPRSFRFDNINVELTTK